MKLLRRSLALLLAVTLFVSAIPAGTAEAFVQEVYGEEITLQNEFIKVNVNTKSGRFNVGTVEGQPERKKDQNTFLTFWNNLFGEGIGDTDTSFTTFRINGTDYIFGNRYEIPEKSVHSELGQTRVATSADYSGIPEGCQAIVTPWTVEGVTVTQLLLLYPQEDSQNSGNVQILYHLQNASNADVQVGARLLLDTMVGANDGPEFQIGTISSNTLRVERMLSRDPVNDQGVAVENRYYWTLPGYWAMRDTLDPSNPLATNVIAYGYTDIAGYRDVDYMIVSHWNKLANEKFEEFSDYKAVSPEQSSAAAEVARTQRIADLAQEVAERKELEAVAKEEAAQDAPEGSKAQTDAQKARTDANRVRQAAEESVAAAQRARAALEAMGRSQIGSSVIDPNLDFTDERNSYGSADSGVAFFWDDEGEAATLRAGGSMQIGTVYGLGEIVDPTSVLAISFPNPVTQVELDPNQTDSYKNAGMFDIHVEVENLAKYDLSHDSIDITLTLEKGLRFVKRDTQGNILRDASGNPLTSYSTTQTVTYEKERTPRQAEAGLSNPILPGEKVATTFTVVAQGKPWPSTLQYIASASSPQLEAEFESKYGQSASDDVKALYHASRANYVLLPAVGAGSPSYATSISPEECYTEDPKYITVNLTNIGAYNPGSSVRGQEARPNFNLYFQEIVTGKRYQVDVLDHVQCIVTDDGMTGDMRISYTNGTLVDEDGMVIQPDLGCELPVGEYQVEIDYISTDADENTMLDVLTEQTFQVTTNQEARVRNPGILAVVKESIDFDDSEALQKLDELVAEVQAAVEEISSIAEKLENTDWSSAIYDEVMEAAKELATPVTQFYESFEKLCDFRTVESDMMELAKVYPELAEMDFSAIRNFDLSKAITGEDISLSEQLRQKFDVQSLLLGPLGLQGLPDLQEGGVSAIYDSILDYGRKVLDPITDIYRQMAVLGDFSALTDGEISQLKSSFSELGQVDFSTLKSFDFKSAVGITSGSLVQRFKSIVDMDSILAGPLGESGVDGIFDSIRSYGEDMVRPVLNLYSDVVELADFTTLSQEEIARLATAYPELEGLDFAALQNLDLSSLLLGSDATDSLKDRFRALVDVETLLKGPFGSVSGTGSGVFQWLESYSVKAAAPITSVFEDLAELTDFSDIQQEMEDLSQAFPELDGMDFSSLSQFDFRAVLGGQSDNLEGSSSLSDYFRKVFDYEAMLQGPFGESGVNGFWEKIKAYGRKTAAPLTNLVEQVEHLADFTQVSSDMLRLSEAFPGLEGADFSSLADFDLSDALGKSGSSGNTDLSEAFRAQCGLDDILSGPVDANGQFSVEKLNSWMERIFSCLTTGSTMVDLAKKAAAGGDPVQNAQELVNLYRQLLNTDIAVNIDAALTKAKSGQGGSLSPQEKLSLAFVAMFAKMKDVSSALEAKYRQAEQTYQSALAIKDQVVEFVQAIGSGNVSKLLSLGKEKLQFVLDQWLAQVRSGMDAAKELLDIGQKAASGTVSVWEGARLLRGFYEKYLNVSPDADCSSASQSQVVSSQRSAQGNGEILSGTQTQAEQMALAFVAMYAKLRQTASSMSEKIKRAGDVYDQAKSVAVTVVNVGSSLASGDFSSLMGILTQLGNNLFEQVLQRMAQPGDGHGGLCQRPGWNRSEGILGQAQRPRGRQASDRLL